MMIFSRIIALFFIAPIFSSDAVSYPFRIFLGFLISLLLFPSVSPYMLKVPPGMGEYALIILSEVFVGVLIGFILNILFASFQMAGEYFSVQLGFGYTEILDPVSQTSLPVMSTLKNMIAIMLFLITGAHRKVIESIAFSFEKASIYHLTAEMENGIFRTFEYSIGAMFLIAFKIALPILGVIILVTAAEALMGKAAPQMNILQLSFPAKIAIGLIVMILVTPFIEQQMVQGFELSLDRIDKMLRGWPRP